MIPCGKIAKYYPKFSLILKDSTGTVIPTKGDNLVDPTVAYYAYKNSDKNA